MYQQMMYLTLCLRNKVNEFISDERGEVNIVAIVVLIGIAVILALIFKEQIIKLLETLFASITKSATEAVTPSTGP